MTPEEPTTARAQPPRASSPSSLLCHGVLCVLLAAALLALAAQELGPPLWARLTWAHGTATVAEITLSDAQASAAGRCRWRARVGYVYRVDGIGIPGKCEVALSGASWHEARAALLNYATGKTVPVRFDPRDPSVSSLELPTPEWPALFFAAFALYQFLGGLRLIRDGRRAARSLSLLSEPAALG